MASQSQPPHTHSHTHSSAEQKRAAKTNEIAKRRVSLDNDGNSSCGDMESGRSGLQGSSAVVL